MANPLSNMKMPMPPTKGKASKKKPMTDDESLDALFGASSPADDNADENAAMAEGSPEEEAGETEEEEATEDADTEEALKDFSDEDLQAELDRRSAAGGGGKKKPGMDVMIAVGAPKKGKSKTGY